MTTKLFKSINLIRCVSGANLNLFRYTAMVLVLLLGVSEGVFGTSTNAYLGVKSAAPAQGLVYLSTSSASGPSSIAAYQEYYPGGCVVGQTNDDSEPANLCYIVSGQNQNKSNYGPFNGYAWAKPARGFEFDTWTNYMTKTSDNKKDCNDATVRAGWNGTADNLQNSCGGGQCVYSRPVANFKAATEYTVTYLTPVGGTYTVSYSYLKTRERTTASFYDVGGNPNSYHDYEFYYDGEEYSMTGTSGNTPVKSYAADEITLTVPSATTNFIGWYEGDNKISESKTLNYTPHANVSVCPMFKELAWGDASGDLAVNVTAKGEYGGKTVYVAIPTLIGSWSALDFTVAPMSPSNEFGSIAIGTISLDKTTNPNRLVIPYTYTASNWGGVDATFTITPSFGATKQFSVACSAEEVVDYEACIEENEVRTYTGTLAEMMTQANSMNNQPVLKLMQNKTITAPLSFTNSFTFDVNGKVLTANCTSAFSIDAAGKDVKIIDGSFTQVGEIHTSHASAGVVSVVTFTQAAKLTMQGGTLSAENTGTGSAYGVNVCNGSIFYMTNGQLTVTGVSEAHGIHVATASDYATLNGGSLTVSAPTQAYGLWSAGQSNITDATIDVEATTGAKAYGVYVNGGTSTLTTTTITADAKTTEAYGACVNAGRLNVNGGSFAVTAITDKVDGVYVASGATAMIQMNANVTATLITGNGSNNVEVCGVNNKGTVSLNNISVTATSATNRAAAVNTEASAVSTTIEGGSYTAQSTTELAYGLHHQYGTLNVDGGTFTATAAGNGKAFGVRAAAGGSIANATLKGEVTGAGTKAHGLGGVTNGVNISVTNCSITAKSAASIAYGIYSRANVTATGCTITATANGSTDAYGLYAEAGTNNLINCNATIFAHYITAYGVNHLDGTVSINGGQYDVEVEQSTNTVEDSKCYGIYNAANKTINVANATFNVTASNTACSRNVYGAYVNGVLNSDHSSYVVKGRVTIRGIYGNTESSLNLTDNNIYAESKNGDDSYGVYAKKNFSINGDVVRSKSTSSNTYAMYFENTASGEVLDGKFAATGNGTTDFGPLNNKALVANVVLKGGIYTTPVNLKRYMYTGYGVYTLDNTHPDYVDGYRYIITTQKPSPYVCYIKNGNKYETLAAALQYTKDNSGTYTIIMTQNHTLPAGEYELPKDVTLLIPCDEQQVSIAGAIPTFRTSAGVIEEHLCLTLDSGAYLNVNGKIEVGGEMYCPHTSKNSYNNSPYGRVHMEKGSLVQLNDGAFLYAWGFITGKGEIKAKSNSEVHEMFQTGDMKTLTALYNNYNDNEYGFFPLNQYFVQNIEVPTTYYYNSRLTTAMCIYYKETFIEDHDINLVGTSGSLFLVKGNDESSWVRKSYDATLDYQVYEVNSQAQLGSISLSLNNIPFLGSVTFNSSGYILPITSNMKIHIKDGDFAITQSTQFLPGSSIEINKTASLTINSGKNIYVFDKDQWPLTATAPVFSPSWNNGTKPSRSIVDAAFNVHGNINVTGKLYTSKLIASGTNSTKGANIFSNNQDAGTVKFNTASGTSDATVTLMTSETATRAVTMELAQLKNKDGSFTSTSNTASDESFIYLEDQWQKTYTNDCFEVIGSTVYAKPSEYVALTNTAKDANDKWIGVAESNHTYAAEGGKILILMDDCQWWEVVATSDPTVFECKKTGYEGFYYYDDTSSKWKLKTVNVKFYSAETGDNVLKTIVTDYNGIPDQAVIASNPTKATTTGYTYTFYGWKSSVTGDTIPWTGQLEVATDDMSYRPVFTETKRNYTITLNDANNGATVYLEVPYNDMPEYEAKKDATAQYTYSFNGWSPALAAVTGTATYTAQWTSVTNRYTVTWMNGDDVLETDKNQEYGKLTSYDGATPTKAADNNYAYTFSGWLNSLTGNMRVNNETVTGAITYTAQFSTTPRYMITFANYDGTQLQREPVTQNETPIYNGVTPARARDLDGYYIFTGWKRNSTGIDYAPNAELPAATQKETYTAQYSYTNDLFTITLKNVDGNGATWSGKFGEGSTPFYNPNNNDIPVIPTKTGNAQYSYTFDGWSLTSGGAKLDPVPAVSGEATYWALFTQSVNKYDITFANIDGFGASQTIQVEYGSVPVCPVVPRKEEGVKTWAFESWAEGDPVAVTGDATYTAQFSSTYTTRQFDITFDLDNGTQVVVPVTYGETPSWTGETPVKPTDAQYTYTFSGWYPDFEPVTEEASYLALYTETVRSYTVRFVNWDGTELKSSSLNFGATPTPPSNPTRPAQNGKFYTFNGWSPAISSVAGDQVYTAQYTEQTGVATVTNGTTTMPYSTWSAAFQAANQASGCTIKLYADVTANAVSSGNVTKSMTIDLNGYTISCSTSSTSTTRLFYMNTNNCTLTINDSKGSGHDGMISFTGSGNAKYFLIDVYYNSTSTVAIINGGIIHMNYTGNSSYYGSVVRLYNTYSTLKLYGGELIATATNGKGYAIEHDSGAKYGYAYIYGGKLKAKTDIILNTSSSYKNRNTLYGGYYSKDPGTNVTIDTDYEKVQINNATEDAEFSNGYTYKVIPKRYTLTWNVNGGNALTGTYTSGSVSWGTTIVKPADPTRTGYTFNGWNTTPAATMPKANTTYTAQWSPNTNTPYTVKHYKQNVDDDNYTLFETEDKTGTTAANVTPETKNYTGFTAPATQTEAIAADGSLVIEYEYTRNSYELSWDANGGTISGAYTSGSVLFEAPITAPTVTRAGYEFAEWNATPLTTMPAEPLAYTAQWTIDADLVVEEGAPVVVSEDEQVTTTTVHVSGELQIEEGTTLATDNLILEASAENSGEITGGGDVTVTPVTGNVYFDLTLNTWGRHWHSFGVPWQVDLDEHQLVEVKNKNGEPCNRPLVLDVDYDIVWYNGQTRADHHGYVPACWEYIVDYTDERHAQLYPGKAYMIGFASAVGTVRFVKKSGAPIFYNENVEVMENGYNGDDVHGGWNAIANPKVYHTLMSGLTGVSFAQVHKSDTIGADTYQPCSLDDHKFVVGMAVYVQAQETQPVTINKAGSQPVISAPHRRVQGTQDINTVMRCEVEIAPEGGKMADRIYVQPEDEKEDRYVAGKDVSKMGVSGKRAQMWIERYGQKLCVNTIAPVNDKANYPLSVYAPADGNYSIYLNNQPSEDITLYLTYDGRAIWNLSSGEYMATLNKGTDTHYGLRIVRKTPAVATGIEETTILNGDAVRKVIVDDKIFVIRGNNVYSIDGQMVK